MCPLIIQITLLLNFIINPNGCNIFQNNIDFREEVFTETSNSYFKLFEVIHYLSVGNFYLNIQSLILLI